MAGLIDISIKTKSPRISFEAPDDARLWKAIAVQVQKSVRVRTEKKGEDVEGKAFIPYSQAYKDLRSKKGRSIKPNLSFTGKMLGSMVAIGKKNQAIVKLSGEQGFKAFQNEEEGREFFAISDKQADEIFEDVSDWIGRKNGFK